MPHVSTHYRIYLGAAHHRRPRNPQPWVEPESSSEADVAAGGVIRPYAPPTLAYTSPTGPAEPRFIFWSINDGVVGRMQASRSLQLTVTEPQLELIAWYYLPAGGGNGNGDPAVLIDGYSVSRGDFFDEDFVTVTSDPSLTDSANITGRVPTTAGQTIQAHGQYRPTNERFDAWVTSGGEATAVGDLLTAPKDSGGLSVAVYVRDEFSLPKLEGEKYQQSYQILYGITNDAPGVIIVGGVPVPVDPWWGPFLERLVRASAVYLGTAGLSKELEEGIRAAALDDMAAAAEGLRDAASKLREKG